MLFVVSIVAFVIAALSSKFTGEKNVRQFSRIVMIVFIIVAVTQIFTVVPAGHVGVVDFLGHVSDQTLKAGVNLKNPMARVIQFSIKTQEMMEVMNVPSQEGLDIKLDVSVLYHLDPEMAAEVYKTVGPRYESIVLIPQFRSIVRGVTASYEAKALYTTARDTLSIMIRKQLKSLVAIRGVVIESTPLRSVGLPSKVVQAIEEKLRAEQESQKMQFVLLKEKQEAERKRIEAKGIADFQNIVSRGISEQLLKWKGIEATEKLANSQNTKVIIVGGKDGLPLILGTQ